MALFVRYAVASLHGTIAADRGAAFSVFLAVAITAGVHLACGRRTVLSVGIGTACYVLLVNTL